MNLFMSLLNFSKIKLLYPIIKKKSIFKKFLKKIKKKENLRFSSEYDKSV